MSVDLLLVEDESLDVELIGDALRRAGVDPRLRCVDDEPSFRSSLALKRPDAILADWTLPSFSGARALEIARLEVPEGPFLFVSETIAEHTALEALRNGAVDYVFKHQLERLASSVSRAIDEARERLAHTHQEETLRALQDMVVALVSLSEARDPYTAGHQERVADLAAAMAVEMGLGDQQIEGILISALVHDIGKFAIPSEILTKPTALKKEEMELVRTHVQAGVDVLQPIHLPWPVAETVLHHHERLDGSGYPQHLQGEAISLEGRILAVADTVEGDGDSPPVPLLAGPRGGPDHDRGRQGQPLPPCCRRGLPEAVPAEGLSAVESTQRRERGADGLAPAFSPAMAGRFPHEISSCVP